MKTVKTMSIENEDLGVDYAIMILIIAFIIGSIVQSMFLLSASVF